MWRDRASVSSHMVTVARVRAIKPVVLTVRCLFGQCGSNASSVM